MVREKLEEIYDFLDKMMEDIKYWWKTKMSCKINKKTVNKFKDLIFHEIIHYKMIKSSAINIDIVLELGESEEEGAFYYNASCKYNYPYKFNHPKYYPKLIFLEFKGFLFDIICDTFKFVIFTTLRYRLFEFLRGIKGFNVQS